MSNLSYDRDYEIIGGRKFFMAVVAPFVNHISTISRLTMIFTNYIDDKNLNAIVLHDADICFDYEKFGVKEYWIVDQWSRRIEVYHLVDEKYIFDDSYVVSELIDAKEQADSDDEIKSKIKVSIFDDLIVDVDNVFKWWIKGE